MTRDELRRIEDCVQNNAEDALNDTLRRDHPALFEAKRALVAKASDRLCQTQALILRETAPEINALIVTALRQSTSPQPQSWQPIETFSFDDTVILRPHRIWGAIDVRYINDAEQETLKGVLSKDINWRWMNGDKTTAWTDEAFLPFWMPLPPLPLPPQEPT